uniref:Plastid-encoded RNA polymerase subunit alpha n=1 Tax=Boodleopsis sp. H.0758 TaxID=2320802 RepID=A0A386AZP5_9CHLO|nr:RNA polymerase a-subunit [Boodleopsis sp. H.0758]AYC64912.1 RNA polymerase a-subunit [Boodleopsis sp. H.0758]
MNKKKVYCISSRIENTGQLYGCFKIGPFVGHQSLTFANALRRTLLADKPKFLFKAIQIYGIEHEYSNLEGVRESVIDIMLNLEKLIFKLEKPIIKPQIASIFFNGPGILKAESIIFPSGIKCINLSQYIAALEINGQLKIKLYFSPNFDILNFLDSKIVNSKIKSKKEKITPIFKLNKLSKKQFTKNFKFYNKQISFFSTLKIKKNRVLEYSNLWNKFSFIKKTNRKYLEINKNINKNFLFIKSSTFDINKINYTLQSDFIQKNEFILFEIWTNGSLNPKKTILKGINNLLLEIFPFSKKYLKVFNYESFFEIKKKFVNVHETKKKRKHILNISKKNFKNNFLNLEIGNFQFDLDTFIFLKKNNICRIIDFVEYKKNLNINNSSSLYIFNKFLQEILETKI